MCGIVGIAPFNQSAAATQDELTRMCNAILHRGPDSDGTGIRSGVGLGMRRLSIIDVQGGKQPIANEDDTVRVVFNGEIYNYQELRADLRRKGHVFSTNSDTEVIVHAYEEYGLEAINKLNGMFALALHDSRKNLVVLARDHLGIKPLYYAISEDCVVWGSEIKTLLTSRRVSRSLNSNALGEFFTWEYIPGESTLFNEINKLAPGHLLVIDLNAGSTRNSCYWDISTDGQTDELSFEQWSERILEQLDTSVKMQLCADVPLGAFLSGGVDSSLIVSAMNKPDTFSIGFDDSSWNELEYSGRVARHLGVSHTSRMINPEVVGVFDHLMYFMDDPIADFSIFPTYLVSLLAREHVTVALSGDGGDELFGGYESYLASQKFNTYRQIPSPIRKTLIEPIIAAIRPQRQKKGLINKAKRFVEGAAYPEALGHARWRMFLGEAMQHSLFTPEMTMSMTSEPGKHIEALYKKAEHLQPLNRSLYVDVHSYLVDNCLVKTDRMSMAASLEARVPFLDKNLVELAFRVPDKYKIRRGETKAILKHAAAKRIPHDCVYRPKQGFSIPIKNWLGTQFRPLLEEATRKSKIEGDGIFSFNAVEKLKNDHLNCRANNSHILWSLIVFDRWKSMWLESEQ